MPERIPLDELLGDGFTLLSAQTPHGTPYRWWQDQGPVTLQLDPVVLPGLLSSDTTVVVRPDRYVAAVTTNLEATTRQLSALLGVPHTLMR